MNVTRTSVRKDKSGSPGRVAGSSASMKASRVSDMTATMRWRRMPGRARRGLSRVAMPGLLLLALLCVEWAAFGSLDLFGVRPRLSLVLACLAALHGGIGPGMLLGAGIGLLADVGGGHLLGLSVLGYAAAALAAGLFSARLYSDRFVIVLAAVALGTAAEQAVYVAAARAFGYELALTPLVTRMLPVLILYHWLLTPALYPLGRWLVQAAIEETTDA